MPATGELIRLMNYIDDIATTLRRISASIPAMTTTQTHPVLLTLPVHTSQRMLRSFLG